MVYYRPTKSAPKVNPALAEPIKAMIEADPSFGYCTVANLLGFSKNTVQRIFQLKGRQVRKRAIETRPRIDEARPGRPRTHDDETVAELLTKVLHEKPDGATHWSARSVATQAGISKSSVARYLSLFRVQRHRSKSFKLSTDSYFVEKVRDIVGLYLSPLTNALVLCVDEKS
jgi:AraC-like DNA-binding protein